MCDGEEERGTLKAWFVRGGNLEEDTLCPFHPHWNWNVAGGDSDDNDERHYDANEIKD